MRVVAQVVGSDYSAPYRSLHMSILLTKRTVLSLGGSFTS